MAVRRTFTVRNVGDAQRGMEMTLTNYKSYIARNEELANELLFKAAKMILENTLSLTPEDTSALRHSGRAILEKGQRGKFLSKVTFGGETSVVDKHSRNGFVDYALIVHEDMEANFKVGGPKYLTRGAALTIPEIKSMFEVEFKKENNK